ncbi:hypothetical protein F53441_9326 [Fusarium austroafricanum]|uniref:Uncharacterized protein n=1 Tax=Fusarium austroafricanum TaxID=2364996 RepID=A0A8H4KB95_9HYPO|nr:hypothetical protein F53441_9326 [Fusarium austroafricanum]
MNGLADIDYDDAFEDLDADLRRRPRFNTEPNRDPNGRQNNIIVHNDIGFRLARERFGVDQDVLFDLLPRTRDAPRRGILSLREFFVPPYVRHAPVQLIHWALGFVFRHLSEYSRTGTMDMFGAAVQDIQEDPIRHRAIDLWTARMHALCVVLNNGRGLGCSEGLLSEIIDFFEFIIRDVQNLLGWNETAKLFESFAGIVRTDQRDLVHQIRRIWNRFDPEVQEQVREDMRRALPVEDIDGMAHRMYRTLGY